jgi:hypothetical protein
MGATNASGNANAGLSVAGVSSGVRYSTQELRKAGELAAGANQAAAVARPAKKLLRHGDLRRPPSTAACRALILAQPLREPDGMLAPPSTLASSHAPDSPDITYWIEPGTGHMYPLSYGAYRRAREAEEKRLPRHQTLGPMVDYHVWQRERGQSAHDVDVMLRIRADVPPRIRRMISEVLLAIRRGHPAPDAIRQAARRFGLRHERTRSFIAAAVNFEMRSRHESGLYETAP